jgi:hypothetical protein
MSFACLNGESKILKNGTFLYQDSEGNIPFGHTFENPEEFESGIIQLDSLYRVTKDLDYLSDKGLLLILLKQYEKAINLYLEIEKLEPNRYSTASNIGTAYELIGQNESALIWINKAIKINPAAHNNSEWIHANILQAKIKGDSLINSSFLINADFTSNLKGLSFEPAPETKLSQNELKKLADALYYQLNERVSFIKGKDKIVSKLMFYLGDISYLQKNYFDAFVIYSFARNYSDEEFHKQIDERINIIAQEISSKLDNLNSELKQANRHEISHSKLEKIYMDGLKSRTSIIYILSGIIGLLVVLCIYLKMKNNS